MCHAEQVENPIAYEPSRAVRALSVGHLHARYAALLLAPWHLSADYSYDCIPLLRSLSDPRNMLTLALYGALAAVVAAGARPAAHAVAAALGPAPASSPCSMIRASDDLSDRPKGSRRRPEQPAGFTAAPSAACSTTAAEAVPVDVRKRAGDTTLQRATAAERDAVARWRLFVAVGLLAAPFVPASNVVLWVGTSLGERLLYLPSIGFCLLAGQLTGSFLSESHGCPETLDLIDLPCELCHQRLTTQPVVCMCACQTRVCHLRMFRNGSGSGRESVLQAVTPAAVLRHDCDRSQSVR